MSRKRKPDRRAPRYGDPQQRRQMTAFLRNQDLMPIGEVADRWNAMSGESLSRQRVAQIINRAEAKLLAALAGELGPDYQDAETP